MLTEIYDQLEELGSVLEASFSDLRISMNKDEQEKLTVPVQKLSDMENKIANIIQYEESSDSNLNQVPKPLKLELGLSLQLK